MNVLFYSRTNNLKTGSYRIWVHDLAKSLNESKNNATIVYDLKEAAALAKNFDTIIFCKSAYKDILKFKEIYKNKIKIGAINVSCDYYDENIDFVIVGSLEEYVSMSSYKNVFVVPLIERKFENKKNKKHTSKNNLRICFHGHYPHLFKFEPFIKNAIEKINSEIKTTLVCITGNPNYQWQKGRPNVEIEMHDYSENFEEIVKSCDIGIVPNVSDIRLFVKDIQNLTSIDLGLYNTDYFLRMKNKTNAGRAYVFYQLGIPVIHDLSPSSFELLSKSGYNTCAHDEKSYYKEIKKLLDYELRNKIASKNKKVFLKHYNPIEHAKKLIEKIKGIK
tara:strand:+ start:4150 stop:5148 length:999 start_codon:yes stop_codon:yes gene_type:complete